MLSFFKTANRFLRLMFHFTFHQSSSSCIFHQCLVLAVFYILTIIMDRYWYHLVILTWIYLMIHKVDHLLMGLLPFLFLLRQVCSNFCLLNCCVFYISELYELFMYSGYVYYKNVIILCFLIV